MAEYGKWNRKGASLSDVGLMDGSKTCSHKKSLLIVRPGLPGRLRARVHGHRRESAQDGLWNQRAGRPVVDS